MPIFFLSDIHLSENTPDITAAFTTTLQHIKTEYPEAVFIMGDLFNTWIGDTLADNYAQQIAQDIHALATTCPVFFQRGNRDFLISQTFCAQSGMTLLPDRYSLTLDGKTLLLEHGDLLCTNDIGYQRMRHILRHPYFYWTAAHAPKWLCQKIANHLRKQSQHRTAQKLPTITDVSPAEVERIMTQYNADILIHGHTHRPARHLLKNEQERIVLGDWRPYGEILKYQDGLFTLTDFAT